MSSTLYSDYDDMQELLEYDSNCLSLFTFNEGLKIQFIFLL
jgi:hypothetical protein